MINLNKKKNLANLQEVTHDIIANILSIVVIIIKNLFVC